MLLFQLLIILVSVAVLTLGAELFVRGASILALRLGISPLFVGLTVVGFGTSSPELGASMTATLSGNTGISMGNVVGSNIINIGFILGLTAVIRPIYVSFTAIRRDLFVALGVCAVPLVGYLTTGSVSRPLGILSLVGLTIYLTAAYLKDRAAQADIQAQAQAEVESSLLTMDPAKMSTGKFLFNIALGVIGLTLLIVSSNTFVAAATKIAQALGVSDLVIGLTIVALGTSLPELVTSVVAAYRRSSDVAVGNIIGSNIFNILGILGVCAVVAPQPVTAQAAWFSIPVMIGFSIALIPFVRSRGHLSRREGAALLAAFIAYSVILGITSSSGA